MYLLQRFLCDQQDPLGESEINFRVNAPDRRVELFPKRRRSKPAPKPYEDWPNCAGQFNPFFAEIAKAWRTPVSCGLQCDLYNSMR
jgi:hypothetical protein